MESERKPLGAGNRSTGQG